MSFIERICRKFASRVLGTEIAALKAERDAALSRVENLLSNPVVETTTVVHRDIYKRLILDNLEVPLVNSSTTPTQAAYLLGMQRVLRVVEKELVSG